MNMIIRNMQILSLRISGDGREVCLALLVRVLHRQWRVPPSGDLIRDGLRIQVYICFLHFCLLISIYDHKISIVWKLSRCSHHPFHQLLLYFLVFVFVFVFGSISGVRPFITSGGDSPRQPRTTRVRQKIRFISFKKNSCNTINTRDLSRNLDISKTSYSHIVTVNN